MHFPKCVRYRCKTFFGIVIFALVAYVTIVQCVVYLVMEVRVKKFAEKVDNSFRNSEICRMNVRPLDMRSNRNISEEFQLHAIVMAYNRPSSLRRLLDSLNKAYYHGDKVRLEVWIDRSKNGTIDRKTLKAAESFRFKHGSYEIFMQPCHAGIYGQWMGTWHLKENSSEIGVFLEDDVTVSPYFFKWLKTVHKKYDHMEHVNGYALQGVSMTHGINSRGKYLDVDKKHKIFLYPILGTWGFSPKIRNWLKFLNWYQEIVKNSIFQPIFEGIWPSEWYKIFLRRGESDTMWEMWHIYHAWKNKEFTLYCNFPGFTATTVAFLDTIINSKRWHRSSSQDIVHTCDHPLICTKYQPVTLDMCLKSPEPILGHQGLAINWKEPGLHYSKNDKETEPDPLLLDWKPEYEDLPENPVIVDVNGNEMLPES